MDRQSRHVGMPSSFMLGNPSGLDLDLRTTGNVDIVGGEVDEHYSHAPHEDNSKPDQQIHHRLMSSMDDTSTVYNHDVTPDDDNPHPPLLVGLHSFNCHSDSDSDSDNDEQRIATMQGKTEDSHKLPLPGPREKKDSISSESSYYDTVSSTSSTAALLKKVVATQITNNNHVTHIETLFEHNDNEKDNEFEDFTFEYTKSIPKICIERVENCSVEAEIGGLMQSVGTGQALLAHSLEQVRKSFEDLSPVFVSTTNVSKVSQQEDKDITKLSNTYLKNLAVLSLGFMLAFTAFFSLRNLQSSINHEGGLGLVSMSSIYGLFMVGCVFAPSIVSMIKPKLVLVVSLFGMLVFVASNFYPKYYTLIPASALLGFSMSTLWTAQGTYITSIAVTYAAMNNKEPGAVLGLFNGFFLFMVQVAQILGNLISSAVFNIELDEHPSPDLADDTLEDLVHDNNPVAVLANISYKTKSLCGAAYCHSFKIDHAFEGTQVQPFMILVLLGVFTAFVCSSIIVLGVFLNELDVIFRKPSVRISKQLVGIFSLHRDRRLLALVPLMVFLGLEQSFMFGEITKAFITCPIGLHLIGYVMMCFGACDALASFLFGRLQNCIPRPAIICFGATLNIGLLLVMYFWKPVSNEVIVIFILAGAWGVADAIWQTQTCSLCGILFPNKRESSFASLRMYEAIGFTVSSAYAQFLCMDVKMYIMAISVLTAVVGYFIMESVHEKQTEMHKQKVKTAFI